MLEDICMLSREYPIPNEDEGEEREHSLPPHYLLGGCSWEQISRNQAQGKAKEGPS